MKMIDLGWPSKSWTTSTVDYLSDSWASCFRFSWFNVQWTLYTKLKPRKKHLIHPVHHLITLICINY